MAGDRPLRHIGFELLARGGRGLGITGMDFVEPLRAHAADAGTDNRIRHQSRSVQSMPRFDIVLMSFAPVASVRVSLRSAVVAVAVMEAGTQLGAQAHADNAFSGDAAFGALPAFTEFDRQRHEHRAGEHNGYPGRTLARSLRCNALPNGSCARSRADE